MKVKAISIVPPKGLDNPELTPELLASVLGRNSRSNDGLDHILSKVDLDNPDKSIDSILKFVDYGHASIAGLTGGIPVSIEGVTMALATILFNLAPQADGQESSTRYITLDESGLADFEALGFSGQTAESVRSLMVEMVHAYKLEYNRLERQVMENPELVVIPEGVKPAAANRMRKNYALDRARYYLPMSMLTNVSLVMTAREWGELICGLLSTPLVEAVALGELLKNELEKYCPRLLKHAKSTQGWFDDMWSMCTSPRVNNVDEMLFAAKVLTVSDTFGLSSSDLNQRESRYDRAGYNARSCMVGVRFANIAVAELRDLNRHRAGVRRIVLDQRGFYLPKGVHRNVDLLNRQAGMLNHFDSKRVYLLALGSQGVMDHIQPLDKWAYEIELRTGPGSHFRYASHMLDLVESLRGSLPESVVDAIRVGQAEAEPI